MTNGNATCLTTAVLGSRVATMHPRHVGLWDSAYRRYNMTDARPSHDRSLLDFVLAENKRGITLRHTGVDDVSDVVSNR